MKLEINKTDDGVEIHLLKDDGSKTVWLCEDETAAFYKLSSLVFATAEDPKQAKRSILVGDFRPENSDRKDPLRERAERLAKRLGATVQPAPAPADEINAELLELLKQMKETPYKPPFTQPGLQPSVPNYPGWPMPSLPYFGDLPGQFPTVDVTIAGPGAIDYTALHSNKGCHGFGAELSGGANFVHGAQGTIMVETHLGSSIDVSGNCTNFFKFGKTG